MAIQKLVRVLMKIHNVKLVVELKNGTIVSGTITGCDIAMNTHLKQAKLQVKGKNPVNVDFVTVRGANIRYIIFPDNLDLGHLLIDDVVVQKLPKKKEVGRPRGGKGKGKGRR